MPLRHQTLQQVEKTFYPKSIKINKPELSHLQYLQVYNLIVYMEHTFLISLAKQNSYFWITNSNLSIFCWYGLHLVCKSLQSSQRQGEVYGRNKLPAKLPSQKSAHHKVLKEKSKHLLYHLDVLFYILSQNWQLRICKFITSIAKVNGNLKQNTKGCLFSKFIQWIFWSKKINYKLRFTSLGILICRAISTMTTG